MIEQNIINSICIHYNVQITDIMSPNRKSHIVDVKQCVVFALNYLGFTQKQIAKTLKYSDHTTVYHLLHKRTHNASKNDKVAMNTIKSFLPMMMKEIHTLTEKLEKK